MVFAELLNLAESWELFFVCYHLQPIFSNHQKNETLDKLHGLSTVIKNTKIVYISNNQTQKPKSLKTTKSQTFQASENQGLCCRYNATKHMSLWKLENIPQILVYWI